jgi:hypothetical protein
LILIFTVSWSNWHLDSEAKVEEEEDKKLSEEKKKEKENKDVGDDDAFNTA